MVRSINNYGEFKDTVQSLGKLPEYKEKKIKKILKRTSTKVPSYSARKAIAQIADNTSPRLVREVEERVVVPDNRSLYFKEEFIKDVKKDKKWLS